MPAPSRGYFTATSGIAVALEPRAQIFARPGASCIGEPGAHRKQLAASPPRRRRGAGSAAGPRMAKVNVDRDRIARQSDQRHARRPGPTPPAGPA